MTDSQKPEPSVETNEGTPAPPAARKKKTAEERKVARRLRELSLKAPKSPLMLSSHDAWRQLCAKTGCGIAFATFAKWIRDGKVPAVRLGGRIFVPKKILEGLIEHCFAGEPLM